MQEEDSSSREKISLLEGILKNQTMDIKVQKNKEPILYPGMFNGKYSSIRNPGAFIYDKKYGLLCTVRSRLDNKSRLHLAWGDDGKRFILEENSFIDLNHNSLQGVEDSRIFKIKDEYFITYTEFKGKGNKVNTTRIGLVKTKDFKNYYDRRIILDKYGNNKNCVIFNDKESNGFYIFHRPFNEDRYLTPPGIRIAKTKDFLDFKNLGILFEPRPRMWDSARVGMNSPPIEIRSKKFGNVLFMLYHGANQDRTYSMGYVLINKDNPLKILERSENPLLEPELTWEKGAGRYSAENPNVIFGCNAIPISKNKIKVFYAGADMYTGFADLTLKNAEVQSHSTD